jgi:hypothetical protein
MATKIDFLSISEIDIRHEVSAFQGNSIFSNALGKSTPQILVPLLLKYISFNRYFGAGVAHLSSELAISGNFVDSSEPLLSNDRSMDIAGYVFSAAIDEFGDTSLGNRPTHRTLAQATMNGIIEYSGYSETDVNRCMEQIDSKKIDSVIMNGYAKRAENNEKELFRALGFHIGSEFLADQEFRILDNCLQTKYPELITFLQQTTIPISDYKVPAYHWVKIHTSVEECHFENSLKAANMVMQYYAGSQHTIEVGKQILEGVSAFASFQEKFMKMLEST